MKSDSGLVWEMVRLEFKEKLEQYGLIAKGWKKWFVIAPGAQDRDPQWHIADVNGWTQQVQKTGVEIGIFRQNRGFIPGRKYRISFQAYLTAAQQKIPTAAVGIHPQGAEDFPHDGNIGDRYAELLIGDFHELKQGKWKEIHHEFEAPSSALTIFLIVDFEGVRDGVVSLNDVKVECGTGNPGVSFPWMEDGSPPVEPPYIYGIHDPDTNFLFLKRKTTDGWIPREEPRPGWIMRLEYIGDDPTEKPDDGRRYGEWVDGLGVIVRLQYGDYVDIPPHQNPDDPTPNPATYHNFARRCANFVKASTGAGIWSIGNEPVRESHSTAEQYALCYCMCRHAIKTVKPKAQVITGGMEQAEPEYLEIVIREIERLTEYRLGVDDLGIDGFAIHSYTHNLAWTSRFGEYERLLSAIPESYRMLPVYITEAGSGPTGQEYPDENHGYIKLMFQYVHDWNQSNSHKIRSVNFFRWNHTGRYPDESQDHWGIEHKSGMQQDFSDALDQKYFWKQP